MTTWMNCPRCERPVDEFECDCDNCGLRNVWTQDWSILNEEVIDFMTTGTDWRMAPRSDSG